MCRHDSINVRNSSWFSSFGVWMLAMLPPRIVPFCSWSSFFKCTFSRLSRIPVEHEDQVAAALNKPLHVRVWRLRRKTSLGCRRKGGITTGELEQVFKIILVDGNLLLPWDRAMFISHTVYFLMMFYLCLPFLPVLFRSKSYVLPCIVLSSLRSPCVCFRLDRGYS